jgi:hypothetical protein
LAKRSRATAAQLKDEIERDRAPDKVAIFDPAATPLGTPPSVIDDVLRAEAQRTLSSGPATEPHAATVPRIRRAADWALLLFVFLIAGVFAFLALRFFTLA